MQHLGDYTAVIKKRILALEDEHKEKEFERMLEADEIYLKPAYPIPRSINLEAGKKIRLGNLWASKAGNDYRYCLVYSDRQVDGAYTKSEFLEMIRNW